MLLIVRHGQTAANAQGLLLGRADPPLNEPGERQARAVAPGTSDTGSRDLQPVATRDGDRGGVRTAGGD